MEGIYPFIFLHFPNLYGKGTNIYMRVIIIEYFFSNHDVLLGLDL